MDDSKTLVIKEKVKLSLVSVHGMKAYKGGILPFILNLSPMPWLLPPGYALVAPPLVPTE